MLNILRSDSMLNVPLFPRFHQQAWLENLRKIFHNVRANNICPMMCLKKQ